MDKKTLRKFIRECKAKHTAEELERESRAVVRRLEAHELFRTAKTICLYASLPDEVDTHALIERYRSEKRILLPSVKGNVIELHEYGCDDKTLTGDYGITESGGVVFADYDSIDLVIVPGMAFDRTGNRLGRGKGYYDRFLSLLKASKVGICFDFQMVDSIPTLPHDIRMDVVIHSSSAPTVLSDGQSE